MNNFNFFNYLCYKEFLLNNLPDSYIEYLRDRRKKLRSLKFKTKQFLNPVEIVKEDIKDAFRRIGISKGDSVFMHSAMSKFGLITGGAGTVIDALSEVVGLPGTIAMPAFPISGNTIDYLKKNEVFDVANSPSRMGVITEVFRLKENVLRSLHPTHSVTAMGHYSASLVSGHHKCETPFDKSSPFGMMLDKNFKILSFGAGIQHFTINHTFADYCGEKFPFKIYLDNKFVVNCINRKREVVPVSTKVHDPNISKYRWDGRPKIARKIKNILADSGKLKTTRIGKGEIFLIPAADLFEELEKMLKKGITVYDLPVN